MKILISGAGGLIGKALATALRSTGWSVTKLTRTPEDAESICWNPDADELDSRLVSGFDAVVHLAGEPVANGRWTPQKKQKIYRSRVHGTRVLAEALKQVDEPPQTFLCASGINYYASSGDALLDETAPAGSGFLSEVCLGWERSAAILSPLSRVVSLRIGVVLSPKGGTLAKMLPLFRLGLGGYAGTGDAYLSWVTLADLIRAIEHVLDSPHLAGPVNVVSPASVTGRVFAESLGRTLGRPTRLHVPARVLRFLLGELADETILSSIRAVPSQLQADGFDFQSKTIEEGLLHCLQTYDLTSDL